MPLSVFTIESVARLGNYLFSDCKVSGTIARKTGLHVHVFGLRAVCAINFSRDQSSDKLINFLDSQLDTRDSRLDPRDSRLNTWYSKLLRIEYRVSRLEDRGSRDCQLTFERYCNCEHAMKGELFPFYRFWIKWVWATLLLMLMWFKEQLYLRGRNALVGIWRGCDQVRVICVL